MKLGPQRNYHKGQAAIRHYANQPAVPYDFCVGNPISCLLNIGSTPFEHSVLHVKAVVAAFNQEKALVGGFSVILQLHRLIVYSTSQDSDVAGQWCVYQ